MKQKTIVKVQLLKSNTILTIILLWGTLSCQAQKVDENKPCNRNTVDISIAKELPKGICIPDNYTVDEVITNFDFNHDSRNDVAIRYSKYPIEDGTMRFYSIYERVNDTTFLHKKELSNFAIPYIKILSESYLDSHPLVDSLVKLYPVDAKLFFNSDTISVAHLIPDFYGKTHIFIYDQSLGNWYLAKTRYWIGELPSWLIRNSNLKEELYGKIYLDEDKKPKKRISLEEFDLIKSKKTAEEESEYFMNNYDVFEWEKDN